MCGTVQVRGELKRRALITRSVMIVHAHEFTVGTAEHEGASHALERTAVWLAAKAASAHI